MSMEREELHRILDQIPEEEIPGVRRYLKYIRDVAIDPVRRALENAPLDDEPLADEERERLHSAEEDFKHGRTLSMNEVKRELNL